MLQFFLLYIHVYIYFFFIQRDYVNLSRRRPTENSEVPSSIVAVETCREKNILGTVADSGCRVRQTPSGVVHACSCDNSLKYCFVASGVKTTGAKT